MNVVRMRFRRGTCNQGGWLHHWESVYDLCTCGRTAIDHNQMLQPRQHEEDKTILQSR